MERIIQNARYLDLSAKKIILGTFRIQDGVITQIQKHGDTPSVIDAQGKLLAPALIDMHVHLREPGYERKETIATGTAAARAGGFSHVVSMPNTNPVSDKPEIIQTILARAASAANCAVLPTGAITAESKGDTLTDFAALKAAGCAAFSDDGRPVPSAEVMRKALIRAREVGSFIISHCEDLSLAHKAPVNEGEVSRRLGLRGNPNSSEDTAVARDVILAGEVGAHIHIAHISTRGSVEIIRTAKRLGIDVSCETCPHYFTLTDEVVLDRGVNAKMNPPLRSERDRQAIIEGLRDGTIDCISTDHAPHAYEDKHTSDNNLKNLEEAANGIVGLETSFALSYTMLVKSGLIDIFRLWELMYANPRKLLGLGGGDTSYILVDEGEFKVDSGTFRSLSRNTPFDGYKLFGKCEVIC